jgi:hypothetical protein
MQQIMYQQSPDIIFAYPDNLEAINTAHDHPPRSGGD